MDSPKKSYIGTKIVQAEPMDSLTFGLLKKQPIEDKLFKNGYLVTYEDGYESWSPADVFERCYREITIAEHKLIEREPLPPQES